MKLVVAALSVVGLLLAESMAFGQESAKKPRLDISKILPLLDADSPHALAGVLRQVMIESLPMPLYESAPNWGNTRMVAHALKWRRKGVLLVPEIHKTPRNDGTWRKYRLTALHPAESLVLDIRNVDFAAPATMRFEVFVAFDARAEYFHHIWESGVRLYSGEVRARFRVKLWLQCEASARLENGKGFLPDAVFQLRVVDSRIGYEDLVFEHVPGIGGEAAHLLGNLFHSALKQWRPSVERRLLERGNQAITRAAGNREVRISLSRIFEKAFGK